MPLYEYCCPDPECRAVFYQTLPASESAATFPCPNHEDDVVYVNRVYGFSYKPPMPSHYNVSLGKYVSNAKELSDGFKKVSEIQSAKTGVDQNITPIDLRDTGALGVTSEGLESTFRHKRPSKQVEKLLTSTPQSKVEKRLRVNRQTKRPELKEVVIPAKTSGNWEESNKDLVDGPT